MENYKKIFIKKQKFSRERNFLKKLIFYIVYFYKKKTLKKICFQVKNQFTKSFKKENSEIILYKKKSKRKNFS